jgi:predicted transposase YbfD/YdcC
MPRLRKQSIILNNAVLKKRAQRKYHLPVLLYYAGKVYRYNSILEAEQETGICYHLIFDNAVGKIKSAMGTHWEFENGIHWLRYHARYVRNLQNYKRKIGFNG